MIMARYMPFRKSSNHHQNHQISQISLNVRYSQYSPTFQNARSVIFRKTIPLSWNWTKHEFSLTWITTLCYLKTSFLIWTGITYRSARYLLNWNDHSCSNKFWFPVYFNLKIRWNCNGETPQIVPALLLRELCFVLLGA